MMQFGWYAQPSKALELEAKEVHSEKPIREEVVTCSLHVLGDKKNISPSIHRKIQLHVTDKFTLL